MCWIVCRWVCGPEQKGSIEIKVLNFNKTESVVKRESCLGGRKDFCLLNVSCKLVLWLVVFGFYNASFVTINTFAHTASVSTSGTVTVNVSASGNKASLGIDNVLINSSCPLGYTISIAGPSDNTLYKGGDNTESNSISASSGTTATPASILGNNLGTWGYSIANNTTISSNFIGLTNTAAQIGTKASASASGGDSLPVYYGVSVTDSLAPGNYTLAESSQGASDNVVTYYLTPTANCANYIIRYNDNGANSSTTMGITHSVVEDDEVTLAASNYQRQGYGFAGWSTVQLNPDSANFQTNLASAVSSGNVFGPNETITANSSLLAQATVENNTQYITLYAVWVKPAQNAVLQNWQGCGSMSNESIIALTDQRDNNVYTVAKLADGKCWMIENLRLDYDATVGSANEALSQGYGGVFSGLAEPETDNFSESTTANSRYISDGTGSIYNASTNPVTKTDIGTTNYPSYRFPRYRNDNTNSDSNAPATNKTVSNMTTTDQNIYSYGNYYTWAAAIANTNYYNTPTAIDANGNTSETAGTSLCPTGWKLPRGGDKTRIEGGTNDFYALSLAIIGTAPANYSSSANPSWTDNSNTEGTDASKSMRTYPNNFLFTSGRASTSIIDYRSNPGIFYGYYWSSTASSSASKPSRPAYVMSLAQNNVRSSDSSFKYFGFSVRCLAGDVYTITLDGNGATTAGSNSTTVIYSTTNLSSVTNPQREYTVSGWTSPSGNNADGTTINGGTTPGTLTSTYTFDGWYKESGATNKIASNAATPILQASTDYTNASGKWTYEGNVTLYAGWTGASVTLPTITKTGYDCGWTTTASGATTIQYESGSSLTPTADTTLYGVCTIKTNLSLQISFDSTYVSSIAVKTGSASGATVGTVSNSGSSVTGLTYNTAYYLVPTYTTGSELSSWAKDSGAVGTLSSTSAANPTYTIGDGTNAVTHTGARQTYTLTLDSCGATNNPPASTNVTYYATTFITNPKPTRSYTVSGFTNPSANNANNAVVSSISNLTSNYTLEGWYTGSCNNPTTKIAAGPPAPNPVNYFVANINGYTDESSHWINTSGDTLYANWTPASVTLPTITRTGYDCGWTTTATGATTIQYESGSSLTPTTNTTLYGVCVANNYTITLNGNGATTAGSASATATYGATTLSTITIPSRSYNISGWTVPSGNNASGAIVGDGTAPGTLNSTYTFNGWYKEAGATNKIASNATTPVLQLSTDYTSWGGNWTHDGDVTLYAGWTSASVTLPTITRAGYDCGWTETATGATTIQYQSGASLTPTANKTLYGVCVAKSYTVTANSSSGTIPSSSGWTVASGGATATKSATYQGTYGTLPSNPTRTGYNFSGWSLVPDGYQQVEYIESNGTQYINSDILGDNSDLAFDIRYSWVSLPATSVYAYVFGSYRGASYTSTRILQYGGNTTYYNINSKGSGGSGTYSGARSVNTIYNESLYPVSGNLVYVVNGSQYARAYVSATDSTYKIGIFAPTSGSSSKSSIKLYKLQVYDNGTMIRNFVPSYRMSDGVAGLYDTINGFFYTSSVGDAFDKGSDVNFTTSSVVEVPANHTIYAHWTPKTYTVTLNGNGATTAGSASATATYDATTLSTITRPSRSYTITGWTVPSGNNANGAIVNGGTAPGTLTSNYTFDGWYKEAETTNLIASSATTPVLQASTDYTDANGKWTNDGAVTLYAGWTPTPLTLPTIAKSGYYCGWTETATGATSVQYESGSSITISANKTLYGVCTGFPVTIHAGNGISSLSATGWTGNGTDTITKNIMPGQYFYLIDIDPTYKTGYDRSSPFVGFVINDSYGSIMTDGTGDRMYVVGNGVGDITLNATVLNTPTCTIKGGTTKVYNRSATQLTATDNSENYDTSSVDITYSFGYAYDGSSSTAGSTATLGDFSAPQTSNLYSVGKAAFKSGYGRFYGVTVTVTDKNDSSITSSCTSGTGYGTSTPANRTRLILVNSRVNFDANGGTLTGTTSPVYVIYQGTSSYSSRTNSTTKAIPGVTPRSGMAFDGWYTAASGGNKVINADGTRVASVTNWTDSSARWIRTSTNSSVSANDTLYAHYSCTPGYICYDDNGANSPTKMSGQAVGSSDTEAVLWASNFQRSSYGFAGWNTSANGSGTNYGPNQTIEDSATLSTIQSTGLTLYAKWVASAGNLQNWNGCSSLSSGAVTALTDTRDNQVYAVAKLADGNCWMIENLRLDYTNSDNSTGALSQGYGGQFAGLAQPETANFTASLSPSTASTEPNSLYYAGTGNQGNLGATIDILQQNYAGYRMPRYRNDNTNTNSTINPNTTVSDMTGTDQNIYSYGNYYNWPAAKANTTLLQNMTESNAADTSLCPSSWKLPTGSGSGDFVVLSDSLGGYKDANGISQNMSSSTTPTGEEMSKVIRSYPNNFIYSGGTSFDNVTQRGFSGQYVSATSQSHLYKYDLYFSDSSVLINTNTSKTGGSSIRCVFSPST